MAQIEIKITPDMIGVKCLPNSDAFKVAMVPLKDAVDRLAKASAQFEEATGFRLSATFDLVIAKDADK